MAGPFKMKGSPMQRNFGIGESPVTNKKMKDSKTSVYLKKENMASDEDWKKASEKSIENTGDNLDNLIKTRSGQKKGTDEYNTTQNKINAAMGSKKVHKTKLASQSEETQKKKAAVDTKAKEKSKAIVTKAEGKAKKDDSGDFKVDYKAERKLVKTEQKKSRKKATLDVKEARKAHGRGSEEVKAAKAARRANRKANRAEKRQMRKDQKENKAAKKA